MTLHSIYDANPIGRFAFIGAGAVVTKSVTDYAPVTGNPARHNGWMSEYGHKLKFTKDRKNQMSGERRRVELTDGKIFIT